MLGKFLRTRRKSRQVKGDAAQETFTICLGSGLKAFTRELRSDKVIDFIPALVRNRHWFLELLHWRQGPMLPPRCTLLDPTLQNLDLLRLEFADCFRRR